MAPSGVTAIRLRSLHELIGTVRDWFKAVLPSKAGPAGRRMPFLVFCSFVTDQVISRRPIRLIGAGRLRPTACRRSASLARHRHRRSGVTATELVGRDPSPQGLRLIPVPT